MLGELPLGRATLRVLRLEGHFTEMGDDPDVLVVRMEDLAPDFDGLLVRGHPIKREYSRIAKLGRAVRYVPLQYRQFFADMTGTYEDFLRRLPRDPLQDKRRRTRRYCEQNDGLLDLREYRTPSSMDEFYRHARSISSKTYQERLLKAGFPEGSQALVNLKEQAARDEARGFLLFLHDQPVAYSYATVWNGIIMSQYLGYDPQYRKLGVGAILQLNLMERLSRENRYRLYDHGQGDGEHKESLATGAVRCADIFYLRQRWKLRTLVRVHAGLETFSASSGKFLDAIGVKKIVRKALRRAA